MKRSQGEEQDTLISEYREFAEAVSKRLLQTLNLPGDLCDEIISAGYLGLVEAASRFDSEDGVDFKTYAYLRIRGSVIDFIRRNGDTNGVAYHYARALQAAHELREDELVEHTHSITKNNRKGSKKKRLAEILDYAAKGALAFRMSVEDADEDISEANPVETPEDQKLTQEFSASFRELVTQLPEKEQLVVREFYYEGFTFSEIHERYPEMQKAWISKLHSRALKRLRGLYEERINTVDKEAA